ncbi:unnamed protein product [Effrenium voratum]|uniref:Uncharacterized protein n=1 Tax=Effrenium voratum TaxID=2562239 RepID=A0AA36I8D7_9DINO|nr:unnamed protein product [Effrenium voratum]CAJ1424636.1 unnamed protein product [Effrenium voratum]
MGPPSLDLSLEEVIKASKGGSGKGRGRRDAEKAKEEEAVSLDMSLEELIEKDYLPAKGKGKAKEENGWEKKSDKSRPGEVAVL